MVYPFQLVAGDQEKPDVNTVNEVGNMHLLNNLFLTAKDWPAELKVTKLFSVFGNPLFSKPGSIRPDDYMPASQELIRNKGISLAEWKLPAASLVMQKDFLGKAVPAKPGIGAIEPMPAGQ
jgi:hypothetical protein